jgi:hypothetical protein
MHLPRHFAPILTLRHACGCGEARAAREEPTMNEFMELKLSVDETQLLAQLLMGDKTRLTEEINHTDRREYREFLKRRQEMLDDVLDRLNNPRH